MLKRIFGVLFGRVWTGLIWFIIGTSGRLLWRMQGSFGFHNMRGFFLSNWGTVSFSRRSLCVQLVMYSKALRCESIREAGYFQDLLTFQSLMFTWCTNSLTFNNCTFCPQRIYVFCIYLRTNSDLCHLQHKLIGFYNRDEKCLLRGTNWVFISDR